MAHSLGRHAVVIGASISGMSAAAAAARHFSRVTVVDRDTIPSESAHRRGVPHGKHLHALLAGGHRALTTLIPTFDEALTQAGAVSMVAARDPVIERVSFDPFPRRDFNFSIRSASRPLLEHVIRTEVLRTMRNVTLETDATVHAIVASDRRVTGISYRRSDRQTETLNCDFVIDASGRGERLMNMLAAASAIERLAAEDPEVHKLQVEISHLLKPNSEYFVGALGERILRHIQNSQGAVCPD